MKLPNPDDYPALFRASNKLTKKGLIKAICERRKAIRAHRDQKMDDRCWLDDYWVWKFLSDSPPPPTKLVPFGDMMQKCRDFFMFRRAKKADPIPKDALVDSKFWDFDLSSMSREKLIEELLYIQYAIRDHRDIPDLLHPRSVGNDRALYFVLPEKIPADFRLPKREDFLGEGKAPHAGCPSFLRSHAKCASSCNIHAWGPCTPAANAQSKAKK